MQHHSIGPNSELAVCRAAPCMWLRRDRFGLYVCRAPGTNRGHGLW